MIDQIVLGTGNVKKVEEIRAMLPDGSVAFVPLSDISEAIEVIESGGTLAARQETLYPPRLVLRMSA